MVFKGPWTAQEAVESFNGLKGCLGQAVSPSNYVKISVVQNCDRVVVAGLVQVANLNPPVLGYVIGLALLGGVVGVFGPNGINVVLGLIFKFAMQMSQLVARARVLHGRARYHLVGVLIDHVGLRRVDTLNLILPLFSTDNKYLILRLNRRKLLRQSVSVAQLYALGSLAGKLVDIELLGLFIEIVKAGAAGCQDVVRLKADHVVEEASEFVDLTLHLDVRARVLLEKGVMLRNFVL